MCGRRRQATGRRRGANTLSDRAWDRLIVGLGTGDLDGQVTATPAQSMVSWSENVSVGQVRPGTESACSANRGIRPNTLA